MVFFRPLIHRKRDHGKGGGVFPESSSDINTCTFSLTKRLQITMSYPWYRQRHFASTSAEYRHRLYSGDIFVATVTFNFAAIAYKSCHSIRAFLYWKLFLFVFISNPLSSNACLWETKKKAR